MTYSDDDHMPPNVRVMYLLEVMAQIGQPVTPTELNSHIGWPKQTIHRLCQTMLKAGILERHNRRSYPGRRALMMATGLVNQAAGRIGVHQVLQRVSRRFGETVNFVRPEPQGMIYVDRVETNWASASRCLLARMCPFTAPPAASCLCRACHRPAVGPWSRRCPLMP